MTNVETTSGFAHSVQVIDSTGICIAETEFLRTGAVLSNALYVLDTYGNEIPIETIRDKLASIRNKSHSELGEAWSKLAQM
jgi:hypothetical protein